MTRRLTDAEAQAMLKDLTRHFGGDPVMPSQAWMKALETWARTIFEINHADVKAGGAARRHGAPYHEHLRHIMVDLRHSRLFRRLCRGESVRTDPCPCCARPEGGYSGCAKCDFSGFLPAAPPAPPPHAPIDAASCDAASGRTCCKFHGMAGEDHSRRCPCGCHERVPFPTLPPEWDPDVVGAGTAAKAYTREVSDRARRRDFDPGED